ncbi:MAG: hypothetical protein IPL64_01015 [Flavobacteriales bacterium]|nr:hypothetical protein [Flavobacteriales bacterium]
MKTLLMASLLALAGWSGDKRTQQPCACSQATSTSSDTLLSFTLGRYALHNVSKNEARELSECLPLKAGMTFQLDSTFYRSLCSCSTKRHCLKKVKFLAPDPLGAPSNDVGLVLEYAER